MGKERAWWKTLSSFGKILISVEGQTEELFIKRIIRPHFEKIELEIIPISLNGIGSYIKIKKEINNLLQDRSARCVSTMYDLYGIPDDFPGKNSQIKVNNAFDKVAAYEKAFGENVNNRKFIPYLQLFEFEGLLFSGPDKIAERFASSSKSRFDQLKNDFNKIRNSFSSPEDINDNPNNHPSRRICSIISRIGEYYKKTLDGIVIAEKIGLDNIRRECRHFNDWLTTLERLMN